MVNIKYTKNPIEKIEYQNEYFNSTLIFEPGTNCDGSKDIALRIIKINSIILSINPYHVDELCDALKKLAEQIKKGE